MAVGVFAILGSMAVMRAITFATEVSVFALNLALAMGLALAIDYTLLIVSRFRDELADGAGREEALVRTMTTAGRTVLFSAIPLGLSMIVMALFPMSFLKSFAYAGVAVVALAAVAAVVVTPAAIMLLGERLDALDVPPLRASATWLPGHRYNGRSRRLSGTAGRKPLCPDRFRSGITIVALLLVLAAPFLGVKWGYPDYRVLPGSALARQVGDELRAGFAVNSLTDVIIVIPRHGGGHPRPHCPLRRGAVAGTGCVVGIFAGRHAGRRSTGSGLLRAQRD